MTPKPRYEYPTPPPELDAFVMEFLDASLVDAAEPGRTEPYTYETAPARHDTHFIAALVHDLLELVAPSMILSYVFPREDFHMPNEHLHNLLHRRYQSFKVNEHPFRYYVCFVSYALHRAEHMHVWARRRKLHTLANL